MLRFRACARCFLYFSEMSRYSTSYAFCRSKLHMRQIYFGNIACTRGMWTARMITRASSMIPTLSSIYWSWSQSPGGQKAIPYWMKLSGLPLILFLASRFIDSRISNRLNCLLAPLIHHTISKMTSHRMLSGVYLPIIVRTSHVS